MDPVVVEEDDRTWRSCCLEMHKDSVVFFSQLGISFTVISFCMYQLVVLDHCEAQSLYSGVMSLCLGAWLPSPRLSNKR